VKSYYGGRDVTPEDLEMALLVGMSPNERRRHSKKNGFSYRSQALRIMNMIQKMDMLSNFLKMELRITVIQTLMRITIS
jgi:cation-transporting P-type ATPase D